MTVKLFPVFLFANSSNEGNWNKTELRAEEANINAKNNVKVETSLSTLKMSKISQLDYLSPTCS